MTRRLPWQLLVAAVLLVLLATLATLQYRWLGDVSQAERERMRVGLRTRTSELTQDFNRELTRIYVAFHVDSEGLGADPASTLADAYAQWQAATATPELVRAIYFVDGRGDQVQLRRLDLARRVLEPTTWPPELSESFRRAQHAPPIAGVTPPSLLLADAIDSRIPALFVTVPFMKRLEKGNQVLFTADPSASARVIVVVLDSERLRRQLLEPLVEKHFGDRRTAEYLVTIVRRDDQATVVYDSDEGATVDAAKADVTSGMFDLRMDELNRLADARGSSQSGPVVADQRVAITIVRRADGPAGRRVLMGGGDEGAWQVRVRHRSGSLDAIVAQSRRRNLAVSLGVLGLLAASVVLILAAAQRQQRLARQQMEFVAAVSHELRTPLAVICSAGENLADGVVAENPQVKRYGALIQSEGRRLRDMVERVLEFAGISSGAPVRPFIDVDIPRVIEAAVGALAADARDRGVTIHLHANGSLPSVRGDADALRSALQNIIGNAVKYSGAGTTVDVGATVTGQTMLIRVVDRGLGIDADDLRHVFKPFHRGRRAVEAQIRGTGVGLSVVRQVIDAHHGDVRIESRPGEGTTVTIVLPVSDLPTAHSEKVSDTSDTSDTRP